MNHKAITLLLFLLSLSFSTYAQPIEIGYIPEKLDGVSDEDYQRGKHYLENTYQAIQEAGDTVYADYWNIAVAYAYMGQTPKLVHGFLLSAKKQNPTSFCGIVAYAFETLNTLQEHQLYSILGERFVELTADCDLEVKRPSLEERFAKKQKTDTKGLTLELVDQLIQLMHKDQYYRYSQASMQANWKKQQVLDQEVSDALVTIFETYGYPGKTLVGGEFMNYACLFLEHTVKLEQQEQYFPLVIKAMRAGEVDRPYVRMLVDRIHWRKTGKQIFGSHGSIPFDTEQVIQGYRDKYGI